MIPRDLHFIWVGGAPMPYPFVENLARWMQLHPRWRIMLWTDKNRPKLRNEAEYLAASSPAQASDILRYEVLLRGGIYLDLDVEPVKPLDPLLDLDAFVAGQAGGLLCNAVLGAAPGHPALRALVGGLGAAFAANPGSVLDQTGPNYATKVLRAHGVEELPQDSFYPYWYGEPPAPATAGSYGIHRWAASWVPPK